MNITFVISSLSGGGAERVASVMANYWAAQGWKITIVAVRSGCSLAYDLHPRVAYREMRALLPAGPPPLPTAALTDLINNCSKAERAVIIPELSLIMALGQAIQATAPEAVISFLDITNLRVLLATYGTKTPVIVTEHSDPFYNSIGEGRERLRRRLYAKAEYVTVLTPEAAEYFSTFAAGHVRIVPNAVFIPGHTNAYRADKNGVNDRRERKILLAMGRLSSEKGFDLLLEAFARLAAKHPCWHLEICGEGGERPALTALIDKLDLAGRVQLNGFTREPFDVMRQADLFVVSSRCEGFSNVLVEAMACGLAAVSFDCPSGPRHIIRDGVDGVLAAPADIAALAAALDRLMTDDVERRRLAIRASEVVERFGIQKVMGMWEELIVNRRS